MSESSNLEGQLAEIKSEHTSLEVNYSELQAKHCTSEEARTRLSKMSEQLNQELESLQSTMESSKGLVDRPGLKLGLGLGL